MATRTQPPRDAPRVRSRSGWITFAGSSLMLAGGLNLIWGITALADSTYFREDGLLWSDLTCIAIVCSMLVLWAVTVHWEAEL